MQTATVVTQMLVRFTGLIQIVLGLLFWTGNARSMVPVHMLLGLIFVLALWVLAGLAARAGVDPIIVGLTMIWSLLVLSLGLTQQRLLPGANHWLIQVAHLLVGLVAIGLGEVLAVRIGQSQTRTLRMKEGDT